MNYFMRKATFHYEFILKLIEDGLFKYNTEMVFDKICDVFLLTNKEKKDLNSVLNNEDYKLLTKAQATSFYRDMLSSVFAKSSNLFGAKLIEQQILSIKARAQEVFESLEKTESDIVTAMQKNCDKRHVLNIYSLYYFLAKNIVIDKLIAKLRKNAFDKTPDVEALLILRAVDKQNDNDYLQALEETEHFALFYEEFKRIRGKNHEYDNA